MQPVQYFHSETTFNHKPVWKFLVHPRHTKSLENTHIQILVFDQGFVIAFDRVVKIIKLMYFSVAESISTRGFVRLSFCLSVGPSILLSVCGSRISQKWKQCMQFKEIQVPSDGVDWDPGGESGHWLKLSLKPRQWFLAYVPIHLHCPDPPRLTVNSTKFKEIRVFWQQKFTYLTP